MLAAGRPTDVGLYCEAQPDMADSAAPHTLLPLLLLLLLLLLQTQLQSWMKPDSTCPGAQPGNCIG